MDPTSVLVLLSILTLAMIISPLGLGGGVLYVPIFLYVMEWSLHVSLVSSLILVWMVSLGSRIAHSKDGYADKEVGGKGTVSAILGTIIGTILSALLVEHIGEIIIISLASLLMVWVIHRTAKKMHSEVNGHNANIEENQEINDEQLSLYRKLCAGGGMASGFLGIGGGAIFVTVHRQFLDWGHRKSAGTSYIIESWMIPMGIITHLIVDETGAELWDILGIWLFIAPTLMMACSYFGATVAINYVPQKVLSYPFLLLVTLALIRYLVDIYGIIT